MRSYALLAAFLLGLFTTHGGATAKANLLSCTMAGVTATYARAEVASVIAAGGHCQPLRTDQSATCVIGNIAQKYAKNEVEAILLEQPDAVCMYNGGLRAKVGKKMVIEKQAIDTRLRIFFNSNSTELKQSDDDAIAEFAHQFADTGAWLTITAYSDKSGSKAYNRKISMQRAEKVKARLLHYGISADKIIAVSALGESATPESTGGKNRVVIVRAYK